MKNSAQSLRSCARFRRRYSHGATPVAPVTRSASRRSQHGAEQSARKACIHLKVMKVETAISCIIPTG